VRRIFSALQTPQTRVHPARHQLSWNLAAKRVLLLLVMGGVLTALFVAEAELPVQIPGHILAEL